MIAPFAPFCAADTGIGSAVGQIAGSCGVGGGENEILSCTGGQLDLGNIGFQSGRSVDLDKDSGGGQNVAGGALHVQIDIALADAITLDGQGALAAVPLAEGSSDGVFLTESGGHGDLSGKARIGDRDGGTLPLVKLRTGIGKDDLGIAA